MQNFELLLETQSTQDFPMVAQYLNKEIGPLLISQSENNNVAIINSQANLYGQTTIKEEDKSYFITPLEI